MTMSTFLVRRRSHLVIGIILACTATALPVDTGLAATKVLSGHHGEAEIQSACGAAGGTFHSGNGNYGCFTDKGAVNCNSKGLCVGECSKCAQVAKGVSGVLRPPASAGTALAAGGTTNSNKHPITNVNQPVAAEHFGGSHSGGSKH
jgi:hypothetical protein